MYLRSLTFEELVARGVDPTFAGVLANPGGYGPDLTIVVGETDWDYFVPDGVSDVFPLWDSNANSYVRWVRFGRIEYVWLFHDDPNWVLIALSEQGIKAKLWYSWCEFQESDEECRRFAEAIGFHHWEKALEVRAESLDALEQWTKELQD